MTQETEREIPDIIYPRINSSGHNVWDSKPFIDHQSKYVRTDISPPSRSTDDGLAEAVNYLRGFVESINHDPSADDYSPMLKHTEILIQAAQELQEYKIGYDERFNTSQKLTALVVKQDATITRLVEALENLKDEYGEEYGMGGINLIINEVLASVKDAENSADNLRRDGG